MATASLLSVVLSAEEFQSLNDSVRLKLEDLLKKHDNDSSQLKIQYAKLQTQSEQQCFELDSQLQQLQEQGRKEETLIQDLTNGKAKVEADLTSSQEQLRLVASKLALLEANCQELKRDNETLVQEKENLSSLLSRRNDDLDRLTGELKTLTDQLVHANREKSEAIIKTEELNSKQLALDYKEKRLDQERELTIRQQRLLQDELDSRTKEVMNIRREKTSKVLELQADLSEKIDELRIAQKTIGELTTKCECHEKHIKELSDRLKELSETEQKMSENSRNELRSQMRLCELYKASSEDAQAKAEELTKATEELQRLLRDASARFGKLETDSKAQIDELNDQLQKSSETNSELKKELERANALIDVNKSRILTEENIEAMSPSAAAASRLLKSGMTLTQIYSQYVSVSEQLLIKEEENKKLNSYIDQILQEIEERAPSVARLKEDYEKSVEMVANLTRQLDLAVEEADTERENALEARRLLGQSQRTSQRLDKQVADLSKQVCFLVRETEELRGNRLRDEPVEEQVTSSEGSASAIISRHLVTFRDVEELQQRNQMLLTTLREVTEKQDAAEQCEIDTKTAKIQQALENALSEVEHLRDTRRRHEELMEAVIQQRDMYRILLQEAGWGDSQSPTKFRNVVTSTPAPARQEGARSTDIEMQLNESKTRLEEHEINYQNVVKEKKEIEKTLNDKIQVLQDQLTDLRAQNVRLGTQTQYADEKEKLLQGNLDSCRKQIHALEEKNKVYACTVAKHEQSIAVLRDEAMNAQQQLARAEVAVSMLQEEKQLLKDAEQRLLIERNSLINERHSQGLLHANLESIKLNLERGESETRMRLQNTVASLEQQTELLRKKLDLEEQRYKQTVNDLEEKIRIDQDLLKAAEEKASQAEIQLATTRERLAAAESRTGLTSPTRKVQVTRLLSSAPASGAAPNDSDLVGDLRVQLAESRTETSKYQEQLELVRQQAEQYRSIADSLEGQLAETNKTSQAFKQEAEQQLIKLNEERVVLLQELEETKDKLKSQEEGAAILDQETAHQSEEVSMRISRLETELASITEQLKKVEESEAKARHDSLEENRRGKEAQERYERELMQHAADVEQLNVVREQLEKSHSQLSVLQKTLARVEAELATGRTSWDVQKELLEKQANEKTQRCAELDKQVDVMQQQIVTLSSRMAAATRVSEIALRCQSGEEANTSLNTSLGEEEARSSDQLLELVRFLRREKEIAISRFEVQAAEAQRLKTQLEQAERHLIDVQNDLQQERERVASSALTSEKHTEMLRRLETLNALTDSNRHLREERSSLASRVEELVEKVKALEAELEPLRASNEESTSRLEELSTENQTLRKQVVAWRTRTNALQERAGRATADEVKKLQTDKEQLQKDLEQMKKQVETMKEAQTKTTNQLTETQRTNTQLITAQQKWQEEARLAKEEARGAKEEAQKVQSESTSAFAKRDEETAKAAEQANQLRRIARKYKTQYEELKVEYDKLVVEKEKLVGELASSTSSAGEASAAAAAASVKEETTSSETAAQVARIQELEAQIAQLTTEIEQLKQENQVLRTNDEKSKVLMKATRQKLAQSATVAKEKEAAVAELAEKNSKIEHLEQTIEEASVRAAALRSQLEGKINRLERENSELLQHKQSLESELDQLPSVYQRQIEGYQKQLASLQQQQVQQTPQQPTSKTPMTADKSTSENPPTANIKPMASGASVTPQRPPVSSSPGQVASVPGQMHRTTPTASIRPMAMTTRTLAVQPTSVSVSPMAPPLIAITTPTPVVQPTAVVREDEPIAGPSFSSGTEPHSPSPSGGNEDRSKKRTRGESPSLDPSVKRTRLAEETEEEVEIVDVPEGGEETAEEYAARSGEMDLVIEYEEQPQDEHEEEEEEVEEGLIESEEEEMVETVDAEEEEQEEEGDEIVVEVEEQRDEVEEQSVQEAEAASATNEEASGSVEVPVVVEEEAVAPVVVVVQQQPAEEIIESEAFAPTTSNESAPPSTVLVPANIRPPPREDRLPSFGRSTLAFEDGGDDGIVPSTPVLLRPRTNDGFAEAVSSPQVNTRFVFGTVPDLSLPAMGSNINAPSHLESQCMEDTRMDLSQLEDNSGRSVPSTPLQVSPHDELPAVNQADEASVVPAGNVEEQGDFEGGPDLEGDAAAEIDLLGEDDVDTGENEQSASQSEQEVVPSTSTEEETLPEVHPTTTQQAESTSRSTTPQPITSPVPTSPSVRPPVTRRGTMVGYPRGRGMSREDPRLAPSPNPNRPVPITWTPNPAQPVYRENPARVFRRSPAVVASPATGVPSLISEPILPGVVSPVQPLMRGRGVARRTRSRAGRRM